MLPPNKISGMKIAFGRGTWVYDDDSDAGYYNFVNDDSFEWKVTSSKLAELEVDEEDLLDCVEQAQKQFGDPDTYRPVIGLLPGAGRMNIGATFQSKKNPRIICVFTPTSENFPTAKNGTIDYVPADAYFEWYYQDDIIDLSAPKTIEKFLRDFDKLSGNRGSNVANTPALDVPHYDEACDYTNGYMEESRREYFLSQVWQYHKSPSISYKRRLKEDILDTWKRVQRVRKSIAAHEEVS